MQREDLMKPDLLTEILLLGSGLIIRFAVVHRSDRDHARLIPAADSLGRIL
jgi:hypothetical protein